MEDIAAMGYVEPTPIQAQCIQPALEGKDVIGLAQTGTGKTAAFGLPMIQKVAGSPDLGGLVLAPTRELAQQTATMLRRLGRSSRVGVAVLVGGIPIKEDYRALQGWPNIVVATPGRLIDHIRSRSIVLSEVRMLAVDEADRMYDMGFIPQIREIIEALPSERQTLMFTATMPDEVENLVRRHMRSPVRVQIGVTAPAARAEQRLYHVEESEKLPLLLDLLRESDGRVLVFARTKRKVERLARAVSAKRHGVARLHGDREQSQRDTAMAGFRSGTHRILIATDIAARGLDVAEIEHVVNYDFPLSPEDYIHRIGRTARVAASGVATSFVTQQDRPILKALERLIQTRLPLRRNGSEAPETREEVLPAEPAGRSGEGREGGGRSSRRRRGQEQRVQARPAEQVREEPAVREAGEEPTRKRGGSRRSMARHQIQERVPGRRGGGVIYEAGHEIHDRWDEYRREPISDRSDIEDRAEMQGPREVEVPAASAPGEQAPARRRRRRGGRGRRRASTPKAEQHVE